MKTRILTQAQKTHSTNALHDAFVAAGLTPILVESSNTESRFTFADEVTDTSIDAVVGSYAFSAPAVPSDVRQLWTNYKNAVNNATTIPQLKAVLTDDLGALLKELLRPRVRDLQ